MKEANFARRVTYTPRRAPMRESPWVARNFTWNEGKANAPEMTFVAYPYRNEPRATPMVT